MTDDAKPTLATVDSPEFEQRQHEASMKRANAIIDWVLARPSIKRPFQSAEFRRAFPDVTPGDVKMAIEEVARLAGS